MHKFILLYENACKAVSSNPQVLKDVERARELNPDSISCSDFTREYAWVVFNSGMKMRTIRQKWLALQDAFNWWDCQAILYNRQSVRERALRAFNNYRKVDALFSVVDFINRQGWVTVKDQILLNMVKTDEGNFYPSEQSLSYICKLPWMGRTNSRYLMKNLGFDLAKDDRHLKRLAEQYGYPPNGDGVQRFVENIGKCVGERVSVVETILWNASEASAI